MKIVFVGTPAFAAHTLAALLGSRHEVCLVVTQPDRPAGRGRRVQMPKVKELALAHEVPVLQPGSINEPECVDTLRALAPDAMVVVAYGRRLSRETLAVPKLGCFNVHASLLPRHRGAAPVHYAILRGDRETGVSIQRMRWQVDAGAVIARQAIPIDDNETTGELAARLAVSAGRLIAPTMDAVESGRAVERPQDPAPATAAPKLSKSDGNIPWSRSAGEVRNFIRAMTPWPGAFTFRHPLAGGGGRRLVVLAAARGPERRAACRNTPAAAETPGRLVLAEKLPAVATGHGLLTLLRVHPEGGRPMSGETYLRGHALQAGDHFRALD